MVLVKQECVSFMQPPAKSTVQVVIINIKMYDGKNFFIQIVIHHSFRLCTFEEKDEWRPIYGLLDLRDRLS